MKTKTLTPEQRAATEEKKEQFKTLCKQFADLSDEDRAKFAVTIGAIATVEGRKLSQRNSWMIKKQNPKASIVGSFNQWVRAGRVVQKGQKGVMIAVPMGNKDSEGQVIDFEIKFFTRAYVFDISQTREIEKKIVKTTEEELPKEVWK